MIGMKDICKPCQMSVPDLKLDNKRLSGKKNENLVKTSSKESITLLDDLV